MSIKNWELWHKLQKPKRKKLFLKRDRSQIKKKAKEFFLFAGIQLTLYLLLVLNYRAVAELNYTATTISDFVIASFNFFVIRKIARSEDSFHQWLGYALGGAIGGVLGLYISTLIV